VFTVGAVSFGREIESEWSVLAFVSAERVFPDPGWDRASGVENLYSADSSGLLTLELDPRAR